MHRREFLGSVVRFAALPVAALGVGAMTPRPAEANPWAWYVWAIRILNVVANWLARPDVQVRISGTIVRTSERWAQARYECRHRSGRIDRWRCEIRGFSYQLFRE
jgi:hypothetical protein